MGVARGRISGCILPPSLTEVHIHAPVTSATPRQTSVPATSPCTPLIQWGGVVGLSPRLPVPAGFSACSWSWLFDNASSFDHAELHLTGGDPDDIPYSDSKPSQAGQWMRGPADEKSGFPHVVRLRESFFQKVPWGFKSFWKKTGLACRWY